ncbi:unnamed protein product, partial [Sphacelaria rigidula]
VDATAATTEGSSKVRNARGGGSGGGAAKRPRKRTASGAAASGAESKDAAVGGAPSAGSNGQGAQKRPAGGAGGVGNKKSPGKGAIKGPAARGAGSKRPAGGSAAVKRPRSTSDAGAKRPQAAQVDKKQGGVETGAEQSASSIGGTGVDSTAARAAPTSREHLGCFPQPPPQPSVENRVVHPLPDKHLPPEATLTFEYEPLCDWDGFRKDVRDMVKR